MAIKDLSPAGNKPRFKKTDYVPKQTVSKAELIGDNKVDDWKVGDLVNHDIFGKGVVLKRGLLPL